MALIERRWLMAVETSSCLALSCEARHVRKTIGGMEWNSKRRPERTVSLTHASDVDTSHSLANRARCPPMVRQRKNYLDLWKGLPLPP